MRLYAGVIVLLISINQALAAEFIILGTLTGLGDSEARGISNDGTVVVGVSGVEGFRWTEATGMVGLGTGAANIYGSSFSAAYDVSADGSVVIGRMSGPDLITEAFRWTQASGLIGLGVMEGQDAWPVATSADGNVLVGESGDPFKWVSGVGFLNLFNSNNFDLASDVSADGSIVVGRTRPNSGGSFATKWTTSTMSLLGVLPNTAHTSSFARGISNDGSIIVGDSGGRQAFKWTDSEGMIGLGFLSSQPADGSVANSTSDTGDVIVGRAKINLSSNAFVWTTGKGMLKLSMVLMDQGIDLDGWTLTEATDVSTNGEWIIGNATRGGVDQAFLANIAVTDLISGAENVPVLPPAALAFLSAIFIYLRMQKSRRVRNI